jgi:hypothetical protein
LHSLLHYWTSVIVRFTCLIHCFFCCRPISTCRCCSSR